MIQGYGFVTIVMILLINLGVDDHLKEKSLSYILNLLRNTNYGLIHFKVDTKENKDVKVYNNSYSFLSDVNYLITFTLRPSLDERSASPIKKHLIEIGRASCRERV